MYCGTYANQQALYMALHRKAEQRGFDLAEKGIKGFKDPGTLAVLTSIAALYPPLIRFAAGNIDPLSGKNKSPQPAEGSAQCNRKLSFKTKG